MHQVETNEAKDPKLAPATAELTPELRAQDADWENELVRLLSVLEFLRVQAEEISTEKRPAPALQTALAMVDHVVGFAQQHLEGLDDSCLPTLLVRAGDLYSSAQRVLKELNGSSFKSLVNLFLKAAADKDQCRQMFRDSIRGVKEVLESSFTLFGTRFHAPASSQQWAQTYRVFLADLAQVLDQLEC